MKVMRKIFVIADERCGGSQLGNMFQVLGYNRVDDPQNHPVNDKTIYNKKNLISNFDYFTKYNYIKVCMASFSIREYKRLLKEVNNGDWKLIFLWRKNFLERALSKAIGESTGTWHESQSNEKYQNEFKISTWSISREIRSNKKKLLAIKKYLKTNDTPYFDLEFSDLYGNNRNEKQRFEYFTKVIDSVDSELYKKLNKENITSIKSMLSPKKRLNTDNTYSRISNIKQIIKKFSNNENGVIILDN